MRLPRNKAQATVIIVGIAIALLLATKWIGNIVEQRQAEAAAAAEADREQQRVAAEARRVAEKNKPLVDETTKLVRQWAFYMRGKDETDFPDPLPVDAWNNTLNFDVGEEIVLVSSAGVDGTLGTGDDIKVRSDEAKLADFVAGFKRLGQEPPKSSQDSEPESEEQEEEKPGLIDRMKSKLFNSEKEGV